MARNKYADFVAHRQNPALPIEVAGGVAAQEPEPLANLIDAEELSILNYSLSRLASLYREMIIRFYLKEQPIAQIAAELDVPVGTVKRRLFDAKNMIKERMETMNTIGTSSYAPAEVNWFWGGDYGKAFDCMEQKIAQQACVICRAEAKTVNQIADELGVAPVYLEPVLMQMVETNLLSSPTKDKYLTNFCVFPERVYNEAEALAVLEFRKHGFPEKTSKILMELKDKITALPFYGNQFDYRYLMWLLYAEADTCFFEEGKKHYCGSYLEKYPLSAESKYNITAHFSLPEEIIDESIWEDAKEVSWSVLHQSFLTTEFGRVKYVNSFETKPFPSGDMTQENLVGRDLWVNGNNISLLLALAEHPKKELNVYEEEQTAEFIKNGLLKKTENGLEVQLPVFTSEVHAEIRRLVKEALHDVICEYATLIGSEIEQMLLPYVRKELMSTFVHWDMSVFFGCGGSLFYYGMKESDDLLLPEDYSRSAAGLYLLKK